MTNNKKRKNVENGSQKGKTFTDAMSADDNILSKEELKKSISPTREKMSDG